MARRTAAAYVAGSRLQVGMREVELRGVAHEGRDVVALRQRLFDYLAAGTAGSAKNEKFHGVC
jgi:hypothetical protein